MLSAYERYQFKPFIGSSHHWALSQLQNLPTNTRVLDIGCGSGAIGQELKQRGVTEVDAIEVDTASIEHARTIYNRVERSCDALKGRSYDLILLLDVIEHQCNPDEFLKNALSLLAPGGTLLISVPNIAHWSVRLLLFFGSFNYTSRGILDKTHFRFFTRQSFRRFLSDFPELELHMLNASIEPTEFVLPKLLWDTALFRSLSNFRYKFAQFLPGLMAYQHLAIAKKR